MYTKERYSGHVKYSVPISGRQTVYEDAQPEVENCSNGIAPQPNTLAGGARKMKVPVVQSMTR